jgi:hypothetical protein
MRMLIAILVGSMTWYISFRLAWVITEELTDQDTSLRISAVFGLSCTVFAIVICVAIMVVKGVS